MYLLPAPPGYWLPATDCLVYRQSADCQSWDTGCQLAEDECKLVNVSDATEDCEAATFYQPCDWESFPEFLDQTIWSLPQGAIDEDVPYPSFSLDGDW